MDLSAEQSRDNFKDVKLRKLAAKTQCFHYSYTFRASYIILDYLQALTPKYAHKTLKKTGILLYANFYIRLIQSFLNDSFSENFLISRNLEQ